MTEHIPVIKCEDQELPVPTVWRKPLTDIVECLASEEFSKLSTLPAVTPLTEEDCQYIESTIRAYGKQIDELAGGELEDFDISVDEWILGCSRGSIYRRRRM